MLGLLKRNLKRCPIDCKTIGYTSMVRSNLEYAAAVWDPHQQRDFDRLERVQRKAARFISNDYTSGEEGFMTHLLKKLELPTLQNRRNTDKLCFVFKIINDHLPAVQPDKFLTALPIRRQIKANRFIDSASTNIIENQVNNNGKALR